MTERPAKKKRATRRRRPGELRIAYRRRGELKLRERNPRTHTDEQIAALAASIREYGWTNPVLVDDDDTVIAGHARVAAAALLGLDEVPTVTLAQLTPAQARAYVIADNRLAETAGWDLAALEQEFEALAADGFALDLTGFDDLARREVARSAARERTADELGQPDEDEFGTVPMRPITRPGDVWHVGPHRVACGDSLDGALLPHALDGRQVHLVATDPPYAIYGSSTGVASDIADDKMVRPFFERVLGVAQRTLPWFGHAYVCCDWRSWAAIWEACRSVPLIAPQNVIVWDKGGSGLGSNYANAREFVGFFAKLPEQKTMGHRASGKRQVHKPNLMRFDRPSGGDREHNAAKPVALFRELIENSSGPGDLVLDPFCGSGTTTVAADQLGRACVTVDIEPKWCDVTVGRLQRLRGLQATLGADGPTFQAVAQQRAGDQPPVRPASASDDESVH